jgi:hypothetical protein
MGQPVLPRQYLPRSKLGRSSLVAGRPLIRWKSSRMCSICCASAPLIKNHVILSSAIARIVSRVIRGFVIDRRVAEPYEKS